MAWGVLRGPQRCPPHQSCPLPTPCARRKPTDVEWRYTEEGERVRVSLRSGRILPVPPQPHKDGIVPEQWIGEWDGSGGWGDVEGTEGVSAVPSCTQMAPRTRPRRMRWPRRTGHP